MARDVGRAGAALTGVRSGKIPMRKTVAAGVCSALLGLAVSALDTLSAPSDRIPDFTPAADMSWQVNFWDYILDPPPGSGHGPIKTDPRYPYNSQIQNGQIFRGGQFQVSIVNAKDPVLKPWAAKEMQESNDELLSGKRKLGFVAQSRCWPGGVPGQLLFLEPVYFLQTPQEVAILWQRNGLVRHIYLRDRHSAHVKPSWFGESIGHYEGGDTLVVDTIGIAGGKYHYVDNFRTPHTDKLHVVERFTISPDKKTLTAIVKVDDADTFNAPLTLKEIWRRTHLSYEESVCAEDGGADQFNQNLEPIPVAQEPDF
jgi:hypothetical protein